ncbi:phosphoenolpyruvate carboxylase [Escherichia coli]
MCRDWPFFSTRRHAGDGLRQSTDLWLAEYYDQRLVDKALWPLGKELRTCKKKTSKWCPPLPTISNPLPICCGSQSSIQLRVFTLTGANVLQAELLHRSRQAEKRRPGNWILASNKRAPPTAHDCRDCGRYA